MQIICASKHVAIERETALSLVAILYLFDGTKSGCRWDRGSIDYRVLTRAFYYLFWWGVWS